MVRITFGGGAAATVRLFIAASLWFWLIAHVRAQQGCTRAVNVTLTLFSCEPRKTRGKCLNRPSDTQVNINYPHRGSELSNGRFTKFDTDEECCQLCRETPGCKLWSRFQPGVAAQFDNENNCWIKSAIPTVDPEPMDGLNTGFIEPQETGPCNILKQVGFRDTVAPYNDPENLRAENAEECCGRCHEDSPLCMAWMWKERKGKGGVCSLYGNEVPAAQEQLCRDCSSGRVDVDRSKLDIKSCSDGGMGSVHYKTDGRIVIARKNSFTTRTSKECCALCDATAQCRSWSWSKTLECSLNADIPEPTSDNQYFGGVSRIKVCDVEECDIKENFSGDGGDLCESQPAGPEGNQLVVASPEECCLICQEIPECTMWTFTKGHPEQPPTACWLKHKTVKIWKITPGGSLGSAWTGIIASRNTEDQAQNFQQLLENAIPHPDDNEGSSSDTVERKDVGERGSNHGGPNIPLIVGLALTGILVVVICLVLVACFLCRKGKRREDLINMKRMELMKQAQAMAGVSSGSEERAAGVTASARTDFCTRQVSLAEESTVNAPLLDPPEVRQKRLDVLKGRLGEFQTCEEGLVYGHSFDRLAPKIEDAFIDAEIGTVLAGKYVVEPGTQTGENSFVLNTRQKFGHATEVVMKFFRNSAAFDAEVGFFNQQVVTPYVPQVFDMFDAETVGTWGLPALPCIVMERGDSTMSDWLLKQGRMIDQMDQRSILFKVCSAVQDIHKHGIIHRDLKPSNIVMFSASLSWKLIDFGSWAKKGSKAPIEYTLRYAPPEVLIEHASGVKDIIARPSMDIWSLGLIFWEVLTGDPLFGQEYTEEEVMAMLMGVEQLPFEKDPQIWNQIQLPSARRMVDNMLKRAPLSRWPIHKVMSNAFFSSGSDTLHLQQGQAEHTEMLKDIVQAVKRVEEKVEEATDIAMENLKHTVGNVLLCCFSFYEIDSSTFLAQSPTDTELAHGYANNTLKLSKALLEPNYNVFKRSKEDPASLLRLDKKHLVKITLMYGGDVAMELPIASIESLRIFPTAMETDFQDMTVFPVFNKGHLMEGIGVWDTPSHKDMTLKLIGNASIDLVMRLKMKGSDRVTRVRKTIEVRMHDPEENFKLVKTFYRTKDWYSNLPPWAKLYIHGAVTVVSLVSKRVA